MARTLSRSDVIHEAERWASTRRKLDAAEKKLADEVAPIVEEYEAKIAEITRGHAKTIDRLQSDVDAREKTILNWLDKRPKTTRVESRHAIAEVVHGVKEGNRIPDLKKLLSLCKRKGVDVWQHVSLLLGSLDKALGAEEVTAISTRDSIPTKTVTLNLKD